MQLVDILRANRGTCDANKGLTNPFCSSISGEVEFETGIAVGKSFTFANFPKGSEIVVPVAYIIPSTQDYSVVLLVKLAKVLVEDYTLINFRHAENCENNAYVEVKGGFVQINSEASSDTHFEASHFARKVRTDSFVHIV